MALLYEKKGKIAYITIDRPRALNALNPETFHELSKALLDFRDDEERWVAIITGSGNRAFCAGADIAETLPWIAGFRNEWWQLPPTIMRGMELWKPVIAAINGYTLGGGLELALACDLRIASENATFALPEVTLGIIPGWGGTQRLARVIPKAKAAELLLTGQRIDAQEAYRIGLINKVVPSSELLAVAEEMAEKLCEIPPLAVRAAKEAMIKGCEMSLEEGLALEAKLEDFLMTTEDAREAQAAYQEKRKPELKAK
ncbi:enoyl-CoA hydratase/isomerase family protein [Chloroflexota bacterium]